MRLATISLGLLMGAFASAQFYGTSEELMTDVGGGRIAVNSSVVDINATIGIDQKLNTIIPGDIPFTNSDGTTITTGEIMRQKPTLLLMIFYKCGGICSTELNSITQTVGNMKYADVYRDFNVMVVSIEPAETPELAAKSKETFTNIYNRRGTDAGWFFLTGEKENIDKLAQAVGFHYGRDPKTGNIVHPAGLMVVSPNRKITRYFLQQQYDAKPLLAAIEDSRTDKVGDPDPRPFYLSCVSIDPLTGKRSLNIMNTVKTGGVVTLLGLASWISVMAIKAKRVKRGSK